MLNFCLHRLNLGGLSSVLPTHRLGQRLSAGVVGLVVMLTCGGQSNGSILPASVTPRQDMASLVDAPAQFKLEDEHWLLLRDGSLLVGEGLTLHEPDLRGIQWGERLVSWEQIHSLHLPVAIQPVAERYLSELGQPWALANFRLSRQDWQGAYAASQQVVAILSLPEFELDGVHHPAWWTAEVCAWRWHLQQGNWESAQIYFLRMVDRLQHDAKAAVAAGVAPELLPSLQVGWSEQMPPIVLSHQACLRWKSEIQRLGTALIGSRQPHGCWYVAELASAVGNHELAQQCRAAAQRDWPADQSAELEFWKQLHDAQQLLRDAQPVESSQRLEALRAQATSSDQQVVLRLLWAEAKTAAAQPAKWRSATLAWIAVAAQHRSSQPELAAYALYRAEQLALQNRAELESQKIRMERQQTYPYWRPPAVDE